MSNAVQQLYAIGLDDNPIANKHKVINPMIKENNLAPNLKNNFTEPKTRDVSTVTDEKKKRSV